MPIWVCLQFNSCIYFQNSAIFNLEKICKFNNTEAKFIESNISGVVHQPEYTFRVDVGGNLVE